MLKNLLFLTDETTNGTCLVLLTYVIPLNSNGDRHRRWIESTRLYRVIPNYVSILRGINFQQRQRRVPVILAFELPRIRVTELSISRVYSVTIDNERDETYE